MIWNPIIQTAGFDLSDFFKNLSSLIDSLLSFFHTAETTRSPLVLDLNGDGVITTSQSGGVHFDNDGNGFSELTGWIDSNDGLLVIDKNNNGKIDNGNELFGNNTLLADGSTATNGFLALATYDTNKDGKIDASDTQFSDLRVWKDSNSNGKTDSGELYTLSDFNIKSISLTPKLSGHRSAISPGMQADPKSTNWRDSRRIC